MKATAQMGGLTRERIEEWRKDLVEWNEDPSDEYVADVNALCDLALRALSLESVRSEAYQKGLADAAELYEGHDMHHARRLLSTLRAKITPPPPERP